MKTALSSWLADRAVSMTDDRGVELPAAFTDPADEYTAVCQSAGLIDLSFRTQLELSGADRIDFLHGMLSNDVKVLQPGQGCLAALLTEQGRLVADLRVYATPATVLLDLDRRIADKTIAALDRFIIADDVEITDLGTRQTTLAIQGPGSSRVLGTLGLNDLPEHTLQHAECTLGDVEVRLIRSDQTGQGGYEIHVPCGQAVNVWQTVADADGVQPVGLSALNMLRVEAGIPWYGLDMDEDRIVLEVGLQDVISFEKGCYLGQEVVERVSARGHVNRRLSGLLLPETGPGKDAPAAGDRLLKDDKDVGWLTSVSASPRLGRTIGLGYVRLEHADPGTRLWIDSAGKSMLAEVSKLPFLQ